VPALLSLVWLAALAAAGIAALARSIPWLTPLERAAYGSIVGIVVGSLLLIPPATILGLTPVVVASVGALAVVAAAVAWLVPGRGGDRPSARVARLRDWLLGRESPDAAGGGVIVGWLVRIDPWAGALFAALTVRWWFLWQSALESLADGLWAGHEYIWSDWPTHLGIVTRFAWGDNFPPVNTLYAGLPLSYHYLSDLTPAAFVSLGMDPIAALPLHSFVLSIVAGLAIWAFFRRLGTAAAVATLGSLLFLMGAGLGWLTTAATLDRLHDLLVTLTDLPWDEQAVGDLHIRFFNPYLAFLMSQRAYLYGLPLAMLMLTLLLAATRRRSMRWFVAAGVVGGLLPLSHLPTLLAMAMAVPFLALFLARRPWRDPVHAIPWPGWIAFGLVWVGVSLPQLLSQLGGGAGALSAFRFQLGWVAAPDPWWWFWLKNLGLFIPLGLIGLFSRRILAPRPRAVVWSLMPIFVIANVAAFQPWDWDNHKILVYWFLGLALVVAALLVRTWRSVRSVAVRSLVAIAVGSMVLSPMLEHLDQLEGHMRYRMLSAEQELLAARVREVAAPDDLIVSGMQSHDPVMMLSGRQVYMGYWGQLWVSGIPYEARQAEVREIYRLSPTGEAVIRREGIDFVVIGPAERSSDGLAADEAAYAERVPVAAETEQYRVYDVRPLAAADGGQPFGSTTTVTSGVMPE
jgi:hypothetical protein